MLSMALCIFGGLFLATSVYKVITGDGIMSIMRVIAFMCKSIHIVCFLVTQWVKMGRAKVELVELR